MAVLNQAWGCTALLGLSACANVAASGADLPPQQTVRIHFSAVNGDLPVRCGSRLTGVGKPGVDADVKDLRFYISQLALLRADGVAVPVKFDNTVWQLSQGEDAVALIDLEDASSSCASVYNTAATNTVVTGTVPVGNYVGLRASMGVPVALNHGPTTGSPAPLDIAAMSWSWQAGRRFAKIELSPLGGVTRRVVQHGATQAVMQSSPTFNLHLGSSGCTAQVDAAGLAIKDAAGHPRYSCSHPNRVDFTLPHFDAAKQQVALDLGQLFKDVNLTQDDGGAVGCMAGPTDPECVPIFKALQLSFGDHANGLPLHAGATQTVFRAVAQ
jgi:uncharacterized repeat protein (TIGR04052 family)